MKMRNNCIHYLRITKYDPKNRDHNGWYIRDEWTDYSDIGKSLEGKALTRDEYLQVESAYISSVLIECLGLESLKAVGLEYIGKNPKSVKIDLVHAQRSGRTMY